MEDTITQNQWSLKNNIRGDKSIIEEAKESFKNFIRPPMDKIPREFQGLANYQFEPLVHLQMPETLKRGLQDLMCLVSSVDAHTYENSFGPYLENMFTAVSYSLDDSKDNSRVWCFNGSVLTKTDERKEWQKHKLMMLACKNFSLLPLPTPR